MMTGMYYTHMDSPIGRLRLVGRPGVITGLYVADHHKCPPLDPSWMEDASVFTEALRQLDGYFAGKRTDFDLQVELNGTPFQATVWQALTTIPYGETSSYGEIAARIGRPGSSRAVGAANGRNPVSIVVPCHRVIGADGSLTGYGWGTDRKTWLLDHERRTGS
jgi:methylated-DNA-[protein]-cysteine S-methyltransferase